MTLFLITKHLQVNRTIHLTYNYFHIVALAKKWHPKTQNGAQMKSKGAQNFFSGDSSPTHFKIASNAPV